MGLLDKRTVICLDFHDALVALPVGPTSGDAYICSVAGNGWTLNYFYWYDGAAWIEEIPAFGQVASLSTPVEIRWFDGTGWVSMGAAGGYWSRDIGNGIIYPTTLTDRVTIGHQLPPISAGMRLSIGDGIQTTCNGGNSVMLSYDGEDCYYETRSTDMSEGVIFNADGAVPNRSGILSNIFSGGYPLGWGNNRLFIFDSRTNPITVRCNSYNMIEMRMPVAAGVPGFLLRSGPVISTALFYMTNEDQANIEMGASNAINWLDGDAEGDGVDFSIFMDGNDAIGINGSTRAITFNAVYSFPTSDGLASQVLTTNGLGVVSWQNAGGTGYWSRTLTVIHPTTITDNVSIGNTTGNGYQFFVSTEIGLVDTIILNQSGNFVQFGDMDGGGHDIAFKGDNAYIDFYPIGSDRVMRLSGSEGLQLWSVNAANPSTVASLHLRHTRGNYVGGPDYTQNNDVLGTIDFCGHNNANNVGAFIQSEATTNWTLLPLPNCPADMSFWTTPDDNTQIPLERLTLHDDGTITFNTAYTFPNADGAAGRVLQTNGLGVLSWAVAGGAGYWSQTGTVVHPTTITDQVAIQQTTAYGATPRPLTIGGAGAYGGTAHLTGASPRLELYASGLTATYRAYDIVPYGDALHIRNLDDAYAVGVDLFEGNRDGVNLFGTGAAAIVQIATAGVIFHNAYTFPNADGTADTVLMTDGAGDVEWVNPGTFAVNQAAHGFTAATPIYWTGAAWAAAQSDDPDTVGTHVVVEVVDAANFRAANNGRHTITGHGLTVGEYYFVSDAVAGTLTDTEPTTYSNPLVFIEDANTAHILPFRASQYQPATQDGWTLFSGTFTYISATSFSVSNTAANQAIFKVGRPITYRISPGTWDYGIVTAYVAGTITLAGASMAAGDDEMKWGDLGKVQHLSFAVNGEFADAAESDLLENDLNYFFKWKGGLSYCVLISHILTVDDSGVGGPATDNPFANVTIGSKSGVMSDVCSSNGGDGLRVRTTWQETTNDINVANYQIDFGDDIEIKATPAGSAGENLDAANLTLQAIFVYE